MTKSKFRQSIADVSDDQLNRLIADVQAEKENRGASSGYGRIGQMTDNELESFAQQEFRRGEKVIADRQALEAAQRRGFKIEKPHVKSAAATEDDAPDAA